MKKLLYFLIVFFLIAFSCVRKEKASMGEKSTPQDKQAVGKHLYPVYLKGKWGYINQDGVVVIEPQYISADIFSDGLARVGFDEPGEIKKLKGMDIGIHTWGFIDGGGNVVFKLRAPYIYPFSEGLANIWGTDTVKYIDKTGRIVLSVAGEGGSQFSGGRASIRMADSSFLYHAKAGYIDKSGKWVIKPTFDAIGGFFDGLAVVFIGNGRGYIDTTGKIVMPPGRFDEIWNFSEGVAVVHVGGREKKDYPVYPEPGRWRYIDKTGKFVDDTSKFEAYQSFSDGLAAVKIGNYYGFIDRQFNVVISPQYTYVRDFVNGLAIASNDRAGGDKGYIDITGKFIIEPIFEILEPFQGPLARACKRDQDGKIICGYINRKGEWIFKDDFQYPPAIP